MNNVERETLRKRASRVKNEWDAYRSDSQYKETMVQLAYIQVKLLDELLKRMEGR